MTSAAWTALWYEFDEWYRRSMALRKPTTCACGSDSSSYSGRKAATPVMTTGRLVHTVESRNTSKPQVLRPLASLESRLATCASSMRTALPSATSADAGGSQKVRHDNIPRMALPKDALSGPGPAAPSSAAPHRTAPREPGTEGPTSPPTPWSAMISLARQASLREASFSNGDGESAGKYTPRFCATPGLEWGNSSSGLKDECRAWSATNLSNENS
mmetsp:Transcript_137/g.484  ORF Transcript_137/g.484 Transcript_137/m.484 type:complete len:216 (-) Transcript_137:54-701(-)